MARYAITTTFVAPNPLRATLLAAEYAAVQAAANNVVDIDAAQTQLPTVAISPRKLARKGAPNVSVFRAREVLTFVGTTTVQILVDVIDVQHASRIVGISFGSITSLSGAVGIRAFNPAVFTSIRYELMISTLRPEQDGDDNGYDEATNGLVASVDHEDMVGIADGESRDVGLVVTDVNAGTFISFWIAVTFPLAAVPVFDFGAMFAVTLAPGFRTT